MGAGGQGALGAARLLAAEQKLGRGVQGMS
jgi:hypothetical protein